MLTVAKVIGLVVFIFALMSSNKNDPEYHCVASQTTADPKLNSQLKHTVCADMLTLGIIHIVCFIFYCHSLGMLRPGYRNVEKHMLSV